MGNLTVLGVKNAKPGRHVDGGGLYLLVKPPTDAAKEKGAVAGSKSWVLRVQKDGKRRDFGLGSAADVSLADARDKAGAMRRAVRSGVDPIVEKAKARKSVPTFKEATISCHAAMKKGWTEGHAARWLAGMEEYAYPKLGAVRVDHVDAGLIRDMLEPIWLKIPNTARRMRQRVGAVLDYSFAEKWRSSESPTRSVGRILAPHTDKPKHFAAVPYADMPDLLTNLRNGSETVGRYALMFIILTAARSGEVRSMLWSEVDTEAALWTVPATKMKSRREHIVPLSPPAVSVLKAMAGLIEGRPHEPVFPGRQSKPLSDMTILRVMRTLGDATVHGFRSSFRDWASEETNFQNDVIEAALAHVNPNATERAYKRTTFFEKRRKLMEAWGSYLDGAPG